MYVDSDGSQNKQGQIREVKSLPDFTTPKTQDIAACCFNVGPASQN